MSNNGIQITDVIVYPVRNKKNNSSLMAFARVNLNDQFIISGIRIFEGENGPFIMFPRDYNKDDKQKGYDICYPITAQLRAYMTDQILNQYSLELNLATTAA